MRLLRSLICIVVAGALCSGAWAHHGGDGRPPGAASGEGVLSFAPYSGPGGTFTFTITFSNGETCVVEMQVPEGTTDAATLASLFAALVDVFCPNASGIDYPNEAGHEHQAVVRREETLEDGVTVDDIRGVDPSGTVCGYQRHIIGSPAVAFFDIIGMTTTGTLRIDIGGFFVQTVTDGKPPIIVKTELVGALLAAGYIASIELNGEIRVLHVDSDAGVGIFCTDLGLKSYGRLALDDDGDGLPNYLDCAGDITGPVNPDESDGNVDSLDFLRLIADWGSPCTTSCLSDITGPTPEVPDGNVDSLDYLLVIAQWGRPSNCPHP
jgi:hypothetical protein